LSTVETSLTPSCLRRLWLVIARPEALPRALAAADALAADFPGGVCLLLEQSRVWLPVRWEEEWRARFHAIHEVPRIGSLRGVRDLPRLWRALRERQRALRALGIAAEDFIVCFAGITRLANAVISAAPAATRKLLCVPADKHDALRLAPDAHRWRETSASRVQRWFLEPLAGLHRTLQLKRRDARGDGTRLVRFVAPPEHIFHGTVRLSSEAEPAPADSSVWSANYPRFAPALPKRAEAASRKVVFFGTPFLLVRNLPPEVYVAQLRRCFAFLRDTYPAHSLVYRPHPGETTEPALLDLPACGFRIESDLEAAEIYLWRRGAELTAIFSVASTAARAALHAGLDAYVFWPTFPFAPAQCEFYQTLFHGAPPEFFIQDLTRPPLPCASASGAIPDATLAGDFALTLRRAARSLCGQRETSG